MYARCRYGIKAGASSRLNIKIPALRSRTSTSVCKVLFSIFTASGPGVISMMTLNLGRSRRVSSGIRYAAWVSGTIKDRNMTSRIFAIKNRYQYASL